MTALPTRPITEDPTGPCPDERSSGVALTSAQARLERLDGLMTRYAAGEAAAFGELYDVLGQRLHRFCLRLSRRRCEADDVFQDALLRLHRARATYVPGKTALPWIFAITRSAYLDRLRLKRRHPEAPLDDAALEASGSPPGRDGSPESDACARSLVEIVDRELGRMSENNRIAYVLLREEELSVAEAAAVVGASCDVVKQRAHRAQEQLRIALRSAGWDGETR